MIKNVVSINEASQEKEEDFLNGPSIQLQPSEPPTPLTDPPRNSFTFVDLFCGAGGFSEGFLLAGTSDFGLKLVAASDINPMTQKTYEGRFRSQLGLNFEFLLQDAHQPSFADNLLEAVKHQTGRETVDVVCGGPPCQGFALFGARNEADPRNDLVLSYLHAIEVLQPRYFVIENVPGLVTMYKGKTVEKIFKAVSAMEPIKYRLHGPMVVNAADYGVPQLRERVLFIGCREDMPSIESIPPILSSKEHVSSGDAISDLAFLQPWMTATSYHKNFLATTQYQVESRRGRLFAKLGIERTNPTLYNHEAAKHTPDVLARFSMIQKGMGLESIPRELWEKHLSTRKKWCIRLDDTKPANTIVTVPDDLIHPVQPRMLTVRENARLQSFDDTFIWLGPRSTGGGGAGNKKRLVEVPQYSQVGNAVPPLMAKAIAEVLLSALSSEQSSKHILLQNLFVSNFARNSGQGESSSAIFRPIHS